MKTVKILTLILISFVTMQSFAQVSELKNATIKSFLTALDGTEATAEKAVAKYCSKSVIDNGMLPMGGTVKIISEDGNCVRFQTTWVIDEDDEEDGTEIMVYDICEEGGKITSFDLDFGDEEE